MECRLISRSTSKHLSQALTGFALLERAGAIRLSQRCAQAAPGEGEARLEVVVDGRVKLIYDMHDSGEIDVASADSSNFYFKRSYARTAIPARLRAKVFPFGLNYAVYPDGFDRFEAERILRVRSHWRWACLSAARIAARSLERYVGTWLHAPTAGRMHAPPDFGRDPSVLFMTRAWDPSECASEALAEERRRLNEVRRRCIELLRAEFGRAFTGGFEHTAFALRNYGGFTASVRGAARQQNYLELLKRSSICVATTGLHGSIAWKTGEYVSFSKAIVSEPLSFSVPGDFGAGTHYLEFSDPERCVEQAARLFHDKQLRCAMMRRNHEYYLAHLKPDVLVLRTLAIALNG